MCCQCIRQVFDICFIGQSRYFIFIFWGVINLVDFLTLIVFTLIIVAVVSAYFFPVNDGSKRVTGAGIRPERRFGSSIVSVTACAANASGSSSVSTSCWEPSCQPKLLTFQDRHGYANRYPDPYFQPLDHEIEGVVDDEHIEDNNDDNH